VSEDFRFHLLMNFGDIRRGGDPHRLAYELLARVRGFGEDDARRALDAALRDHGDPAMVLRALVGEK
jgi:hypothetical protein